MIPPVLVSAYAASPAHTHWDPQLEGALLEGLCALPGVVGLELPWLGELHPHDSAWLRANVPAGATLALTGLPCVMRRCGADAAYGIASADPDGRRAAIADLRAQADDARRLNDDGRARVAVIALHTAPQLTGSGDALADSLAEIAGWDWDGAELVVEHCDAAVPGQQHEKGFLPLADETDAVTRSGAPVGLWLNWGRSAIELRDPDAVTAQVRACADTGLLRGLAFSGAAAVDGPYGAAWVDAHLPLASADEASASLLDDRHVADAVAAAGPLAWAGLKVSRRPSDRTAGDVLRTVAANLAVVEAAFAQHPGARGA
ncbi:DUF4862 family protein [Microbacterium saccharophilum]|uniref:DUF4862 family protein n=1 Tax=Microbacterium saccharophilum TaxID=1213358 RepID=A0A5C8HVH1_9MICO|nr:DUF4862 family protein [Microbacterium saccharophilum]TXK08897.1 DUF4862 family protein [Microbacterium saccharophilum]GEP48082.1 hypothetical protein MSA03_15900 [Microbacterium saccharophilum]